MTDTQEEAKNKAGDEATRDTEVLRIAIQGERGSNSHMAALEMLGTIDIVPCSVSAEVVAAVVQGRVDAAVLPIENSLHGSVAEHYDLLMEQPVRIERESLLRIRHNLIAAPGVMLDDIKVVLSHPVALSQCRRYLSALTATRKARATPFYDTAGSVKHVMAERLRDTAGIAPELAAEEYGAEILVRGIEDHVQNYTRFHLVRRATDARDPALPPPDKMSVAFAVEHRPGTLVKALQALADAGVDLTQIESRPVPGKPWEYVFYVDLRIADAAMADRAIAALLPHCGMVKELGRYKAA
ncbi:ACT domain-containing protein [Granulicella sp. 5B5]|uniref:prephenate dehydratase n=1 Tax=Granulicella sp. 5B5 TaxID=1617967 RepID=UPI0015F74850|nr:prephenate dehydratase domain-containing protein [Granulicella sp. 5B5]QMV18232.1 ACT domain-containing protein [Granulicella sp. 5B5]